LHFREIQAQQSSASSQHKIDAGWHEVLMAAVNFTQAALGAIAVDGIADGSPGCDDAHACGHRWRLGKPLPPSKEKGPAVDAAALLANGTEIVVAPQTLPGAK